MVLALDHADHQKHSRIHVQKNEAVSRRIAFFDFDGTITTKDTLLEIIKYRHGRNKFYFGFLLHSPYLVAYKLGIISNQLAKEKVLRYFFRKMTPEQFQLMADEFGRKEIPGLIRPKALEEIRKLKESGAEVVIVSASAENWIREWCKSLQLQLLATQLEEKNGKMTGRIVGRNCHGEEKVARIQSTYNLADYSEVYCYGDTSGDKPMLALGTVRFFKPFR
jgi:HAD superfamily hydrolase (TIGR01490 family)